MPIEIWIRRNSTWFKMIPNLCDGMRAFTGILNSTSPGWKFYILLVSTLCRFSAQFSIWSVRPSSKTVSKVDDFLFASRTKWAPMLNCTYSHFSDNMSRIKSLKINWEFRYGQLLPSDTGFLLKAIFELEMEKYACVRFQEMFV